MAAVGGGGGAGDDVAADRVVAAVRVVVVRRRKGEARCWRRPSGRGNRLRPGGSPMPAVGAKAAFVLVERVARAEAVVVTRRPAVAGPARGRDGRRGNGGSGGGTPMGGSDGGRGRWGRAGGRRGLR